MIKFKIALRNFFFFCFWVQFPPFSMKNFSFLLNGLLLCGLAELHAAQPIESAQNFQSNEASSDLDMGII